MGVEEAGKRSGRSRSVSSSGGESDESVPWEHARQAVEQALGYRFRRPELLVQALQHASVTEDRLRSNERMEFLGDSVLGAIVAERIYRLYPEVLEGEMTKIKSLVVSRRSCAGMARRLGVDRWLILGQGVRTAGGQLPESLGAAVLEAVIAAVYLDAGYARTRAVVARVVDPVIKQAALSGHQENFKSVLQQHAQQNGLDPPTYRVLDEKGPDHAKCFKVGVEMGSRRFSPAWGGSKKQAEQLAALHALLELGLVERDASGHVRVTGRAGAASGRRQTRPTSARRPEASASDASRRPDLPPTRRPG